ncbi:MAG: TSUP family transporter [Clostridia bacterium]|nr:TSUP family transporter [Clostridia bacterium]
MKKFFMNALIVLVSSAIGFVNGFFGGGGGMLLVPLLEKVMKCPVKKSHATAIAIILPISIAGAITYVINGFFDVGAVISVSGGCVVGGIVGALLLKKLPSQIVGLFFSLAMLAVAVKLVFFGG